MIQEINTTLTRLSPCWVCKNYKQESFRRCKWQKSEMVTSCTHYRATRIIHYSTLCVKPIINELKRGFMYPVTPNAIWFNAETSTWWVVARYFNALKPIIKIFIARDKTALINEIRGSLKSK